MSILSQLKQSQNTDFPNLRPSLDLRFALAKKLDPRITFTRGSTGTYFGSDGIMRTADVNEPRFDHDPITGQSLGLLIEESRTNIVTNNNDFNNIGPSGSRNGSSVIPNSTISPDGSNTASTLIEGTNNGTHAVQIVYTFQTGNKYCYSIFAKAYGSGNRKLLILFGAGAFPSQQNAIFDLVNGTITNVNTVNGSDAKIEKYPNGWYKCTLIGAVTTSTSVSGAVLYLINESISASYAGDGNSGIYVWGAQLEAGALPTSYIPTTASTVTRSADLASMTGTNFSSWYNQSEGTIYIETDKLYPGNFDAYRHPYKIDSGSNADQITAYTLPGVTTISNYGIVTGGRQVNDYQQIDIGSSQIKYKLGQSVSSKYFFFTTSTGRVLPQLPSKSSPNAQNLSLATNMSRLFIGNNAAGGGQINSHISRLTYYPIQVTNQELINLCS